MHDHNGVFIEGKNLALPCPLSVFEAENIGVREALSWVMMHQDRKVTVKRDSLLRVRALHSRNENLLEVGHVIEHRKVMMQALSEVCVTHIQK